MNNTICAIATSHGGAIAMVRISGKESFDIISKSVKHDKCLTDETCINGMFYTKFRNNNGDIIDDVMVYVYRAPHSYTGENSIEITCHDSTYILQKIMETLIENGCSYASPGEYTMRAYMNHKLDLSQAEAVADLISSSNKASHELAMKQINGSYSKEFKSLRSELLNLCSLLELELDFGEEDVEFANRDQILDVSRKIEWKINSLIKSFKLGNVIKNGVPVAIIGAPNVGKSTLLNALLNDDKAIVSNIPGTTRDVIEDTVNIDGICFRFIDTAGIRYTTDTVEKLGIERSKKAIENASIIILMSDNDNGYLNILEKPDQTIIRIKNKTTEFSALEGYGVEELKTQLVSLYKDKLDSSGAIVTNVRHVELLKSALEDIKRAQNAINNVAYSELISEELRSCINHLGEITGEITSDDILGNIFKNFCIGK